MKSIHLLFIISILSSCANSLKGVYEFDLTKTENRYSDVFNKNIEYTNIHWFAILSIDGWENYEFYFESQNHIIYTKGTYSAINDSTFQFNSSSNNDLKINGYNFLKIGQSIITPLILYDDYQQPDTTLILSLNNKRTSNYPWEYKDKRSLRHYIVKIRSDSLDWETSNYVVPFDSAFQKLNNPKPYLMVDNKLLFDMELDKIIRDKVKKVEVLTGDEAKTVLGSLGKNGAIFIELYEE